MFNPVQCCVRKYRLQSVCPKPLQLALIKEKSGTIGLTDSIPKSVAVSTNNGLQFMIQQRKGSVRTSRIFRSATHKLEMCIPLLHAIYHHPWNSAIFSALPKSASPPWSHGQQWVKSSNRHGAACIPNQWKCDGKGCIFTNQPICFVCFKCQNWIQDKADSFLPRQWALTLENLLPTLEPAETRETPWWWLDSAPHRKSNGMLRMELGRNCKATCLLHSYSFAFLSTFPGLGTSCIGKDCQPSVRCLSRNHTPHSGSTRL
jgi:hypothetical protein